VGNMQGAASYFKESGKQIEESLSRYTKALWEKSFVGNYHLI
jgi:hypothetical protein